MNFIKAIPPKYMKDNFGMYTGGNRLGWQGDIKHNRVYIADRQEDSE